MRIDPSILMSHLDLGFLKRGFLGLSLGVFLLIPVDLLRVSAGKAVPALPQIENTLFFNTEIPFLSDYESAFERSVFFGAYNPQTQAAIVTHTLDELIKDYRLKGVVILDQAEAIFEDARTQQSTFVREGDKLGETTVKAIKEGSVLLNYANEEKELRIQ